MENNENLIDSEDEQSNTKREILLKLKPLSYYLNVFNKFKSSQIEEVYNRIKEVLDKLNDNDEVEEDIDCKNLNLNCCECENCVLCIGCSECKKCEYCESCENCVNCKGCNECEKCNDCWDCSECENCRKCDVSEGCENCRECEECETCNKCKECEKCEYCKGCKGCKSCTDCDECKNCDECKDCDECTKCNECYDCDECKECTKCGKKGNRNGYSSGCNKCIKCNKCEDCTECEGCGNLYNKYGYKVIHFIYLNHKRNFKPKYLNPFLAGISNLYLKYNEEGYDIENDEDIIRQLDYFEEFNKIDNINKLNYLLQLISNFYKLKFDNDKFIESMIYNIRYLQLEGCDKFCRK